MVNGAELRRAIAPWWRRTRRRVGLSGVAGALLLLLGLLTAAALPRVERDARGRIETLALRSEAQRNAAPRLAEAIDPRQRMGRFVEQFPPWSQSSVDLRALFASATRARVDLPHGDYVARIEPGSPFIAYTMTLPLHERYATVKEFVSDLLVRFPHASLDDLRLARAETTEDRLDAVVRITLHYRAAEPVPERR
jgi:hypothetical protein